MNWLLVVAFAAAQTASAQTFYGTLENGDTTRDGGAYFDRFVFQAQEDQRVTVRMTGEGFDTYLMVHPPSGAEPLVNDDFEGVSVSQVEFIARESGQFNIDASAYSSGLTGTYEVVVTLGGIAEVETIEGRLVPGDLETIKGEFYDEFLTDGRRSGDVTFELLSYGFDGFLSIRSPSGAVYRNDNAQGYSYTGHGPRISRIDAIPNEPGRWTVYVTSLSPEEMGAYDLRIITTD